jgi:hypothetical protein
MVESALKVGDRVRLIAETLAWRAIKLKIRFVKRSSRSDHESLAAGSIVQLVAAKTS